MGLTVAHTILATAFVAAIACQAMAADTPPSSALPDLSAITAKIYAERYAEAADELQKLTATVQNADLYNLLGFSLRNLDRDEEAGKWYRHALYYDPDHKGALEYQGELFLKLGQPERAKANVQKLTFLCPDGCDELDALNLAIAESHGTGMSLQRFP
ncbi:tetratricopeptide repeat protein [Aminobacter sp. AP02]|uniref:tetratricopeptide repeat protein n=1 Tax=Aminobacter sp. AP02 TaxID=2135737 RepID=UPI000D6AD982|nr:tetratricopeptide repeat protein [Aminobacter sp. AP02]PWK76689.1 tetratricopeptide repeat protein [Aminobacter sp. AP02]